MVIILAVVQFCFGIAIYCFHKDTAATQRVAKIIPFPVAVVNYDFITLSQFQAEKDYIHHFYAATQQETSSYTDIDKQILDQMVENRIVKMEAIRYRVSVNKSEIDDTINNIAVQNGGQDKVEKVLNDLYGLTLDDFRRLVETQLLRDKVNQKVIAHVTARHILIQVASDATPDQVAAAKTKIDGIATEIKNGLGFEDAAKKYSEDSGSAADGGLLQSFAAGDMVPEFSNAAFAAQVGVVTDPVRTQYGWHLIKVESKSGIVQKSFADWISGIREKSLVAQFYKIV